MPLGLTVLLAVAMATRAWSLAAAAALGLLFGGIAPLLTPPGALRFDASDRYVMLAEAAAEGWPAWLWQASCPQLHMRSDSDLTARHADAVEAARAEGPCGARPGAAARIRRGAPLEAQLASWPRDGAPALWLPASGAEAACLQAEAMGDAPAAWQLALGDGASVRWRSTRQPGRVWSWPAPPSMPNDVPTMTCDARPRRDDVGGRTCHLQWPPGPAHVWLCGPLLLRAEERGPPGGWRFAPSAP